MSFVSFLAKLTGASPLEVGATVPDAEALVENGAPFRLQLHTSGLKLFYFFPKAGTPVCTKQACSLRNGMEELQKAGVQIFGISGDSPSKLKGFQDRQQLGFRLLSDVDGALMKAFGVPRLPMNIPMRISFLVQNGKVAWRTLTPDSSAHGREVLKAVADLQMTKQPET